MRIAFAVPLLLLPALLFGQGSGDDAAKVMLRSPYFFKFTQKILDMPVKPG
jgi:hypothetical protein